MIDSLQQAKNDIRQGWETPKGVVCKCCGQLVKVYPRQVYKTIAVRLIKLYRLHQTGAAEYYHLSKIGTPTNGGGDFTKLRYWRLIEQRPDLEDPDKKSDGYWKITQAGINFVEGKKSIIKYCHVYNNVVGYRSGGQINIHDALGKEKFNYPELMGYLI